MEIVVTNTETGESKEVEVISVEEGLKKMGEMFTKMSGEEDINPDPLGYEAYENDRGEE